MAEPNAVRAENPQSEAGEGRPPLPTGSLVIGPFTAAALAMLAGVLSWAIIQRLDPVFHLPPEIAGKISTQPSAEEIAKLDAAEAVVTRHHAALWLAILGGLAGLFLAGAESGTRVSIGRAVLSAVIAAVICGAIGAVSGYSSQLVHHRLHEHRELTPMARTMIMQSYMLLVFGLGLGLAISVPLLKPRLLLHCVIGCMLGGVMAAIVYAPLIGYLLPRVRTERVFPQTSTERLIWISLVTALIGLTVAGLGRERRSSRKVAAASTTN